MMRKPHAMTVRRLIAELKKWPQDMRVGFACHDNTESELQGFVGVVGELADGPTKEEYGPVVVLTP